MPKLKIAPAMSCRRPRTESIRMAEPTVPSRTARTSERASSPWRTGSSRPERSAIRSSVRIGAISVACVFGAQILAQGFQCPVHSHLHRGFRHAGAPRGLGHRHALQLDVLDKLAFGRRKLVKQLGDIAPGDRLLCVVVTE